MTSPTPGFQTARSPQHQGRHWSGQKQSPHRVRLGCAHDYAEPGEPHRTLVCPQGTATVCEGCYLIATS